MTFAAGTFARPPRDGAPLPPTFFVKSIIPKELSCHLGKRCHSKRLSATAFLGAILPVSADSNRVAQNRRRSSGLTDRLVLQEYHSRQFTRQRAQEYHSKMFRACTLSVGRFTRSGKRRRDERTFARWEITKHNCRQPLRMNCCGRTCRSVRAILRLRKLI